MLLLSHIILNLFQYQLYFSFKKVKLITPIIFLQTFLNFSIRLLYLSTLFLNLLKHNFSFKEFLEFFEMPSIVYFLIYTFLCAYEFLLT
jgi:hypothetical protein